jgi:hypothetical protein
MTNLAAIFAFLALGAILWAATNRMIGKKQARLDARSALSAEDLHRAYVASNLSSTDLESIFLLIERATDLPRDKLRPTDGFDRELAPAKGWEFDDGLLLLPSAMQRAFGGTVDEYDLGKNPTIADLVATVSRVKTRESPPSRRGS